MFIWTMFTSTPSAPITDRHPEPLLRLLPAPEPPRVPARFDVAHAA